MPVGIGGPCAGLHCVGPFTDAGVLVPVRGGWPAAPGEGSQALEGGYCERRAQRGLCPPGLAAQEGSEQGGPETGLGPPAMEGPSVGKVRIWTAGQPLNVPWSQGVMAEGSSWGRKSHRVGHAQAGLMVLE